MSINRIVLVLIIITGLLASPLAYADKQETLVEKPSPQESSVASETQPPDVSVSIAVVNLDGGGSIVTMTEVWATATTIWTRTTTFTLDINGNITHMDSRLTSRPNPDLQLER